MKAIEDALGALPDTCEPSPYDGMVLTPGHYERVLAKTAESTMTFAGIKVGSNPAIPDGYAMLTRNGHPCGLIDFKNGTATVVKPSRDPLHQQQTEK